MQILDIELTGYKRFQLNQITSFKMTITEVVQLVLGSNGSGKSSLLAELTPLPADPADYFKEGSKTIKILHRGHTYVLKSWFAPSQKHSFERDGVPLNDGGTVTVQKELVRQEFGITPDIHDLLTGRLRFCDMAPIKRREWFTRLSDTNYDYALSVFQKLRERLRDVEGASKVAKRRLVSEQAKVISPAEEQKLTEEVQQISQELNLLQAHRAPVERASADYRQDIDRGLVELERLSQRLLRTRFVPPGPHWKAEGELTAQPNGDLNFRGWAVPQPLRSLEDVDEMIASYRQKIAVAQELINQTAAEHQKVEETVTVLKRTGAEGVASLREQRMTLLAEGLRLLESCQLRLRPANLEQYHPLTMQQALDSVREPLRQIFTELPANEDRRFSQQQLDAVQVSLQELNTQRGVAATRVLQLGGERRHMELHRKVDVVQCPHCQHRWHLGYSEEESQQLEHDTAELELKIKALDERIAEEQLRIQDIRQYGELYRGYVRLTQGFSVLRPLWDYIAEQGYVLRSPAVVPQLIEQYAQDLQLEQQAWQLEQQVHAIDRLIQDAEQVGDASLAEQLLRLEALTLQLEELTQRLTAAQHQLVQYQNYRRQLQEGQALAAQIDTLRGTLESSNAQMIEMLRRETVHTVIRQLQHHLVHKEESLAAVAMHKGIIADVQVQIAKLELQESAVRLLVRELSPTQGLIAEGLMGFINAFVAQMNNLVRKIWTYPLLVQSCGQVGDEGAELDYKFPLMIDRPDNLAKDISEGSTGQQEIVNLAFKVTAMQYLGLAESPLYLDEIERSFDEAHRAAAMEVVKSLMNQRPFTQLFLVSHYQANYGTFTNSEICVICPNNITVPLGHQYNQHVHIT